MELLAELEPQKFHSRKMKVRACQARARPRRRARRGLPGAEPMVLEVGGRREVPAFPGFCVNRRKGHSRFRRGRWRRPASSRQCRFSRPARSQRRLSVGAQYSSGDFCRCGPCRFRRNEDSARSDMRGRKPALFAQPLQSLTWKLGCGGCAKLARRDLVTACGRSCMFENLRNGCQLYKLRFRLIDLQQDSVGRAFPLCPQRRRQL